jgi:hypothetical protein
MEIKSALTGAPLAELLRRGQSQLDQATTELMGGVPVELVVLWPAVDADAIIYIIIIGIEIEYSLIYIIII